MSKLILLCQHRSTNDGVMGSNIQFQDTASAADAAAESAKQAIAAAQAAAHLANKHFNPVGIDHKLNASAFNSGFAMHSGNSMGLSMSGDPRINHQIMGHLPQGPAIGRVHEPYNSGSYHYVSNEQISRRHSYNDTGRNQVEDGHYNNVHRRHSYNAFGIILGKISCDNN